MTTSQTSPFRIFQEDDVSEECKKLVSILPKEKGWIGSYTYNYQGFWTTPKVIEGVIACQQRFHAQDSDIILVTNPKAGTTWLKSLLFVLVNRKEHPIFNQNHPLYVKTPHDLIPFLELDLYHDGEVFDFSSFTSPRLLSTHLPFASLPKSVQDSRTKLVYLCRNPKDTFISMWHFANRLRLHQKDTISIEEMFDFFCNGVNPYGPFWNHVSDYWKQSIEKPNKVLFLMYEEIKAQPTLQLKRLAEFVECPFSVEEEKSGMLDEILRMSSFENLSNLKVNTNGKSSLSGAPNRIFFRKGEVGDWKNYFTIKGEVGDWKNYFTIKMNEKLNHVIEQKFQGSGLKFVYN